MPGAIVVLQQTLGGGAFLRVGVVAGAEGVGVEVHHAVEQFQRLFPLPAEFQSRHRLPCGAGQVCERGAGMSVMGAEHVLAAVVSDPDHSQHVHYRRGGLRVDADQQFDDPVVVVRHRLWGVDPDDPHRADACGVVLAQQDQRFAHLDGLPRPHAWASASSRSTSSPAT